jgi:hypothetical protein
MNQQKQITLIGMGIIASILMVPIVYAAVEPHIILTMDAGQTTTPFTINNNTDWTVFEIEPSGTYQGLISTVVRTDSTPILVTAANDITDPVIIASWVFDRTLTDTEDDTHIPATEHYLSVTMKRDSGVGVCRAGYLYWDGANWGLVVSASGTSGTYESRTGGTGEFWLPDDTLIWGFGMYNSDSATVCSVKNIAAIGQIVTGLDLTYYRGI